MEEEETRVGHTPPVGTGLFFFPFTDTSTPHRIQIVARIETKLLRDFIGEIE